MKEGKQKEKKELQKIKLKKDERLAERKEDKEIMKTFIEQVVNIKTELKEIKYDQTQTNYNYNIPA